MTDIDKLLLQRALHELNVGAWYSWKKTNDDGSKIPNSERMQYKYLIKIITNDKASGKTKLKNLGLTDDEIKALTGA